MKAWSPFDHKPDAVLGEALRVALEPDDHAGFVRRVLAAAEPLLRRDAVPTDWWEILGGWARPGLTAALLLAAWAAFRLKAETPRADQPISALEEGFQSEGGAAAAPVLLASNRPPDLNVVLAPEPSPLGPRP